MRKNGARFISYRQYRLTDMLLFAVILVAFDLASHFAVKSFGQGVGFIFTITVPITLLVMIRWGWQAVFYAVGDGLLFALLKSPSVWQNYIIYGIGYASVMLMLLPLHFIGRQKIVGKWYFSAAFVVFAWGLMNLCITCLQAIWGESFATAAAVNFGLGYSGLMSLAIAVLLILVLRRIDGMVEHQKTYLKRLDKERREQSEADEFGEEPIDIDDELLEVLNKKDDEIEG